jgi:SAM-dependent methyltransferase
MTAAQRWRAQLEEWAIPDHITAAIADSPWTVPVDVFARRADAYVAAPVGASWQQATEALAGSGTVLDVGAGAGAASLPLAPDTRELIAVDTSESMLAALAERATRLSLPTRTIAGRWPDVAADVPAADVVVCHHVFYNVPNLDAFATALTEHARRRVVVELTPGHPLRPLNPLWKRLHHLDRPVGPTDDDALDVLRELGLAPRMRRWTRPPRHRYAAFADLLAATRRRMCLPPERDDELATALIELGADPADPRDLGSPTDELVTIWWDVAQDPTHR